MLNIAPALKRCMAKVLNNDSQTRQYFGTGVERVPSIDSNEAASLRAATLSPTNQPRTETSGLLTIRHTLRLKST